jgi:hypothetical protein
VLAASDGGRELLISYRRDVERGWPVINASCTA